GRSGFITPRSFIPNSLLSLFLRHIGKFNKLASVRERDSGIPHTHPPPRSSNSTTQPVMRPLTAMSLLDPRTFLNNARRAGSSSRPRSYHLPGVQLGPKPCTDHSFFSRCENPVALRAASSVAAAVSGQQMASFGADSCFSSGHGAWLTRYGNGTLQALEGLSTAFIIHEERMLAGRQDSQNRLQC